jgi:hypothetical protein
MQKQETTLQALNAAKRSIGGRLGRLRKSRNRQYGWDGDYDNEKQSPIAKIGVFESEIDSMERTLESMRNRLDNAKVTIEI